MATDEQAIEALLDEARLFPPAAEFTAQANVKSPDIYEQAAADPDGFWAGIAEELHWFRKWDRVLEWNEPFAKWFVGGKLNAAYNCLDRHLDSATKNKVAIHWEGEPGDVRSLTYHQLWREVCKCANALKSLGVRKGDRVTLYMPMVPELAIACLACARIGAAHSVVFGGFSADSLADRIQDSESKVVVTADGGYRRGGIVHLKKAADEALKHCPGVEKVVVLERVGHQHAPVHMQAGRDVWWHDVVEDASANCPAEEMDAEDLLFILYTSGSTGKPKGIAHTTGGYLTGTYLTTKWVFDLKPTDIYWCTADIGWVTGHSYIVYGPLANGATQVMYEGAPDFPDKDRFWAICEKYGVTIFYTAPTAIRAFMRWGDEHVKQHDLSSLRLLGSVGEPINPEAWMWYHETVGGGRCPIVDTWWQTETGHMMISPLPGIVSTKPGSATRALPGIFIDVVDNNGNSVPRGSGGYLVIRRPWPGMLRTLYRDPERYQEVYWSRFKGMYFAGDGAKRDEDGYLWVLGRVDDVMNVSGHRLSTMEVESALVDHPSVAEAAVIGKKHDIKGETPAAFVTVKMGIEANDALAEELKRHVGNKIGAIARPESIVFTAELPKTRSGKIMRRLLRDVAEGRALGDTTTLADPTVVASLREKYEGQE
ncbi:MAG: acsA [Armatimonadetes bacterium]|nr:acsA [Armatimonadota bacterium]